VASLSSFDQVCEEDGFTNQLTEAINVFKSLMAIQTLSAKTLLIFFNKKDLFESKLRAGVKLEDFCPDFAPTYRKPENIKDDDILYGVNFLKKKFYEFVQEDRIMYKFVTQATSRKVMEAVLQSVYSIILQGQLSKAGLMI
jgi:guanine nucleotide-binding protein G(i) subunit alpha